MKWIVGLPYALWCVGCFQYVRWRIQRKFEQDCKWTAPVVVKDGTTNKRSVLDCRPITPSTWHADWRCGTPGCEFTRTRSGPGNKVPDPPVCLQCGKPMMVYCSSVSAPIRVTL